MIKLADGRHFDPTQYDERYKYNMYVCSRDPCVAREARNIRTDLRGSRGSRPMNYPLDLEEKIERELIDRYGNEWSFMMGSSYADTSEKIPESPRRVFWATMSTHVMYDGPQQFKRHANQKEGYLKIINAEKHFGFNEAINDLIQKMKEFTT